MASGDPQVQIHINMDDLINSLSRAAASASASASSVIINNVNGALSQTGWATGFTTVLGINAQGGVGAMSAMTQVGAADGIRQDPEAMALVTSEDLRVGMALWAFSTHTGVWLPGTLRGWETHSSYWTYTNQLWFNTSSATPVSPYWVPPQITCAVELEDFPGTIVRLSLELVRNREQPPALCDFAKSMAMSFEQAIEAREQVLAGALKRARKGARHAFQELVAWFRQLGYYSDLKQCRSLRSALSGPGGPGALAQGPGAACAGRGSPALSGGHGRGTRPLRAQESELWWGVAADAALQHA